MTNLPFDCAADFYDQTRTLSDIGLQGLDILLAQVPAPGQMLEVGVGTGRIAVPLLERGARLVGCDLAIPMMLKLRVKHPAAQLAQAEAAHLPYPNQAFAAVLTFHVLHLVGAWRTALREFQRVLQPGGAYINSWNWHDPNTPAQQIRDYWRQRVEAHGGQWRRPGIQNREELIAGAQAQGAVHQEILVGSYTTLHPPREALADLSSRISSDTWNVPEAMFETTMAETKAWATQTYPDLDQPYEIPQRFILDIFRFPAHA